MDKNLQQEYEDFTEDLLNLTFHRIRRLLICSTEITDIGNAILMSERLRSQKIDEIKKLAEEQLNKGE